MKIKNIVENTKENKEEFFRLYQNFIFPLIFFHNHKYYDETLYNGVFENETLLTDRKILSLSKIEDITDEHSKLVPKYDFSNFEYFESKTQFLEEYQKNKFLTTQQTDILRSLGYVFGWKCLTNANLVNYGWLKIKLNKLEINGNFTGQLKIRSGRHPEVIPERTVQIEPVFIDKIPEILEQNKIYISENDFISKHLCLCGCNNIVSIQIGIGMEYDLLKLKNKIDIIGNVKTNLPCKSLYSIRRNIATFLNKKSKHYVD
jgi:hypothetical protein